MVTWHGDIKRATCPLLLPWLDYTRHVVTRNRNRVQNDSMQIMCVLFFSHFQIHFGLPFLATHQPLMIDGWDILNSVIEQ